MKNKVVTELLQSIEESLTKLIEEINNTVQYFSRQKEEKGLPLLIHIIDSLSWVIDGIYKSKEVYEEYGFDISVDQINDLLKELLKAMENEDFVLISDILHYEVIEILSDWREMTRSAIVA